VIPLGEQVRPGLYRWSAYHPDWKEQVWSAAIVRDGQLLLVDPQLEAEHWPLLERSARERAVHVLLTIHWHARSAEEIAARFPSTRIWAHSRDRAAIGRRVAVTDTFRLGDALPGGIVPVEARPRTEVLFWDKRIGALLVGDALVANEDYLRTCRASWLPSSTSLDELRATLRPLLELPIELVLVSHGGPLASGGKSELARALSA
jgi:glyoxylase-like metal-dependent hydrolase (beta-lactamase superfamily II)